MKKIKLLLLLCIIGFNLIGCSDLNNQNVAIETQEYYRLNDTYNYNWTIGFQTLEQEDNLGTLLIYEDEYLPLNLNVGFSGAGEENQIIDTEIRVYYDYQPISFKLEEDGNFEYTYTLDVQNHTKYKLNLYLNSNEIIKDKDIHKLFVTTNTGLDIKSKNLEISTDAYGTSTIYDIVHSSTYNNSYTNLPEHTTLSFTKVTDKILSPNVLTINQDKTFDINNPQIQFSKSNYTTNNEIITFNSFISPVNVNEDMLIIICLNFEPYLLKYIPKFEHIGTYFSELQLELPLEAGDYEVTAYTIVNPFEKIVDVGHQFTQLVDRFTITKEK
ncbi:hypothetical protein AN641_10170 [Candidatus Epulonipiscioides gigas]|nr:hypothetical protein AN641_10170 [Epulopiscium sp. SCG-C07WGA-EpuloA2]